MSALVLDTHAWVWWVSKPEKPSRTYGAPLLTSDGRIDDSGLVRVIA